jgi:hypothetical protein
MDAAPFTLNGIDMEYTLKVICLYLVGLGTIWLIAIIWNETYFSCRRRYIEECIKLLYKEISSGENNKTFSRLVPPKGVGTLIPYSKRE